MMVAHQRQRDAPVYSQRNQRKADNPLLVHGNRMEQARGRLPEQACGHDQQQDGIGEGGENSTVDTSNGSIQLIITNET